MARMTSGKTTKTTLSRTLVSLDISGGEKTKQKTKTIQQIQEQ